mgnify:CR=1 FL=1
MSHTHFCLHLRILLLHHISLKEVWPRPYPGRSKRWRGRRQVALVADDGDGDETVPDRVTGLWIQDVVVADSIFYEVFFVVAGGAKELVGVQGDGSKIVAFRVTGIGEGYFPGGAVGLFAVGHDTAAAKVQDHTEDIWLGLQVIHDQITAHAFSNGTKIQGTAIKKSYIVSVHLNFLVAHFGRRVSISD